GPGHFGMIIRALVYILTYGNQIHKIAEHAVLNANMIRKKLKDHYQSASASDSMHEAVFSDGKTKINGFETIHIAKSLIDYGYHPPTVYFPLSVPGAMMIEPTETESMDRIDHFCQVMIDISKRIHDGDETLKDTPRRAFIRKVDEVTAARKPVLNFFTNKA
ncbi:MAG: aminomethyl-transferring glycine dehydrogenase subunit GcvPB, partial [Spirochaetia bacterium]|nr:aminomethyl-transferring glycine dehydrogenase subunit GcvPB [Spirochaetia bacterium]